MYTLTIPGRPKPKKRPRVTKSHTYNPNQKAENRILALWVEKYGQVELGGNLILESEFYYSDKRVADLSNLIKLIEDALGGGGEGYRPFNDRQIVQLHGYRATGCDKERTEIYIEGV